MSWDEVENLVKLAQERNDPVASTIQQLKLNINHISMMLSDPYQESDDENQDGGIKPMVVDIDLSLTAFANSRR